MEGKALVPMISPGTGWLPLGRPAQAPSTYIVESNARSSRDSTARRRLNRLRLRSCSEPERPQPTPRLDRSPDPLFVVFIEPWLLCQAAFPWVFDPDHV